MNEQPTLFTESPPPVFNDRPRAKQIKAAFAKCDASFLALYEAFLFWHGATHTDFIANEVTTAFEQKHYKLSPSQKKALGGMYQGLLRREKIEKVNGSRERDQGNLSQIYRMKK